MFVQHVRKDETLENRSFFMKRKICFALGVLLMLLPMALFSVQATGAAAADDWAVVNYLYDPDFEGAEPSGGTISFRQDAKNYLRRYATLSWNTQAIEVTVTPITHKQPVAIENGTCRIVKAGEYTVSVKNLAGGESVSCTVTMMPVVKMSDQYLAVNSTSGKFWRTAYNYCPTIICENVDRIELDRVDIASGTPMDKFQEERDRQIFGEHVLKFISGSYATSVYIDVYACLAEKTYDEELGKHCLLLTVGDFGEDFSVFLDGVTPLAPGVHKITAVGQHTISATRTKGGTTQKVSNVSPPPMQIKLHVELLMDDLTLEEPITLQLSRWDADFYVNGKPVEGDLRVTANGKNTITAFDKDGKQIEGAFLVREVGSDVGTEHTELVLEFDNPHVLYAILMMIPAALMIAVAIFFFLRRRRIV